jgi:hypothetical protein
MPKQGQFNKILSMSHIFPRLGPLARPTIGMVRFSRRKGLAKVDETSARAAP